MNYMHGKFYMSDVYGGVNGTTEMTIPEAADKQALVDDDKSAAETAPSSVKKTPIFLAIGMIFIAAIALGGIK